jgi:aspartate aminotransferase
MSISNSVKEALQRDSFMANLYAQADARVKTGSAIYDLTLEYPKLEPPQSFDRELKNIFNVPKTGMHRYMENAGFTDTRTAIAERLKKESSLNFSMAEVIMTSGASGAMNMAFKALLNPGEEVILFSPIAYDYKAYVENHSGICRIVESGQDFLPTGAQLDKAISGKTKIVVINSPNNPSGVVYPETLLRAIADVIERRSAQLKTRIYVVSDDSFRKFYFGEKDCPWIIKYYPHTIIVGSYSKELSIPGERIGYTAVSPLCEDTKVVVGGLIHANRTLGFVNAPALMQNVVRALQEQKVDLVGLQQKRDYLLQNLARIGYSVRQSEGALYLLPKTPISDDVEFVKMLAAKYGVLAIPGSFFNAPGHFRLSFCADQRVIEGSITGLSAAFKA